MISRMRHAPNPWKGRLIWLVVLLTGLGGGAMYLYLNPEERSGVGGKEQTGARSANHYCI